MRTAKCNVGAATDSRASGAALPGDWRACLFGAGFLGLAAWFVWGPNLAVIPDLRGAGATEPVLLGSLPRSVLAGPQGAKVNGFLRSCSDCHRLFRPRAADPAPLRLQHQSVVVEHGDIVACRACHLEPGYDLLRLKDGTPLPYSESLRHCLECHEEVRGDFEHGLHGRADGGWDARFGAVRHLGCLECHDPHVPRLPVMDEVRPLPGPRTLRMGEPRAARAEGGR
ncbi:MAG: hypothetical protein HY812_08560 [Planctomycetes bacterium]|nr:hypothetical protein [Planctomycetota bacterium]